MKIIAHRGNKRFAPENTMAAFYSAKKYAIDGIEFDVQFTKDKVPVVIHDDKVDRTTDQKGYVRSYTFKELRRLDAGSWFASQFHEERIPSLEEVLSWAKKSEIFLHMELKKQKGDTNSFLNKCYEIIRSYNMESSTVISSFCHPYLAFFKEKDSSIRTAFLAKYPLFRAPIYAKKIKADAIHIRHTFQATHFYQGWIERGLAVRTYNVHRLKDVKTCHNMKVDSIITNDPRGMTEVIRDTNRK